MFISSLRIVVFFLFSFVWFNSEGQKNAMPVDKWVDLLSSKKDLRQEKFGTVMIQIIALDSIDRCIAISKLETSGSKENKRFAIRLNLIKWNLILANMSCSFNSNTESFLKEGLQWAYELEDPYLIALMNEQLMDEYTRTGKTGLAVMHGLIAKEMSESLGEQNFAELSSARYTLGHELYLSREYALAIPVFRRALKGFSHPELGLVDSLDNYYQMYSWNTIGLSYKRLEKYDSAFTAFHQSLKMAEKNADKFWMGLIKGNMGDVYFSLGQYDSAAVLLKKDIEESLASGQFDNAANSLQLIAQIDARHEQPVIALQKLREASQLLQKIPNEHVLMNLYQAYSVVFQKLGKADSLYSYMQKYLALHDANERVASDNRAEIVKMRLDNVESVNKIISLNKEKRKITIIRNFSISLILLVTLLGFLYFNRQRLKLRLQQQRTLEEKRKAQADADAARDQLDVFTQHIVEKTNLVEKLQEQLMQRDLNETQIEQINSLSQHTILTDEDWDHFKALFEKVYPGFFINLKDKAPDITVAEQRIAALSKLRMPAKEAASLLGISPNSVNKTRQRLRSRLSLDANADLEVYFSSLFGY